MEFTGPMRDAYVGQLVEILEQEGFPHFRIGNEILFRFADSPLFFLVPFSKEWPHNTLINMEWRVAANVGYGYGPGDSRIEPPPMLAALMEKHRAVFSRNFPEKDWTSPGYSYNIFHGSCELLRAAAIRIEDVRPEDLPDLSD